MSDNDLNEPIILKLNSWKGLFLRMGLAVRIFLAEILGSLRSADLNNKSMRSQKGNSPVPPTIIRIFPFFREAKDSPGPLS